VIAMKMRPYGNSGKLVSEIGFGAWQLGNAVDWSGMSDKEAEELVYEAMDRGINFFDTAPNYGLGRSEELLGKVLKGKRESVVINTKFGHHSDGSLDFSADRIVSSVENSLRRLQTDYLDSVILHNPSTEILEGKGKHFEILEGLKNLGKITAYGASVDSSEEIFKLTNNTNSSIIEVMFNVFYQEPAKAFRLIKEKKIGLIIKVPLDSGWLSGKYTDRSSFDDIRKRWSPEVIKRRYDVLKKVEFMAEQDTSMVQATLRFILSYPEVSTVIPGSKNINQLEENVSASNAAMDSITVQKLKKIWEEEIENNKLPW
jgi:aryl-alcohol dehydrogenase-like predicted oxidoreductase